jgi:hypothetical protein
MEVGEMAAAVVMEAEGKATAVVEEAVVVVEAEGVQKLLKLPPLEVLQGARIQLPLLHPLLEVPVSSGLHERTSLDVKQTNRSRCCTSYFIDRLS